MHASQNDVEVIVQDRLEVPRKAVHHARLLRHKLQALEPGVVGAARYVVLGIRVHEVEDA